MINAYNALTVQLILTKYPDLESIKDLGGFFSSPWKKKFFTLFGEKQYFVEETRHFADLIDARFIDGRKAFSGKTKSEVKALWLPYDGHWNQAGSNLFSEFVFRHLKGERITDFSEVEK